LLSLQTFWADLPCSLENIETTAGTKVDNRLALDFMSDYHPSHFPLQNIVNGIID
jgi:hypothetical protein